MNRIHGDAETYVGTVTQSPGVAMVLSLVWLRNQVKLRVQEEPRGPTPPDRQFRRFHINAERLPRLIRKLQAASDAYEAALAEEAAPGACQALPSPTLEPVGTMTCTPNPKTRASAREEAQ